MSDPNFDGVISASAEWVDVSRASTDMVLLGGEDGPLNQQPKELVQRTNYLKEAIDYLRSNVEFFESLQQLRVLSGAGLKRAFVLGAVEPGDGGGGLYRLDAADTTTADDAGTVLVATDGRRYKLKHDGVIAPEVFKELLTAGGDWTPVFAAAINTGLKVFSSQQNYTYAIKTPLITTDKNIDVDLGGNTLLVSVGNTSFRCLAFISTFTDPANVTTVLNNQTVIGSRKGVAVTLDDATAYSVGDYVRLISDDAINPNANAFERNGQSFEVLKKTGNTLYLSKNTELVFATNVRIVKHKSQNTFRFGNAKVRHTSTTVGIVQVLVDCSGYVDPEAFELKFSNTAAMGLRFQSTFRARTTGEVSGKDMLGNTASNQVGYVVVSSGTDGLFPRLIGTRVRHVYTSTAEDISAGITEYEKYGGAVNDRVLELVGDGCHSYAADTHSDAVSVKFDRIISYSNGQERGETCGALQFRGLRNKAVSVEHHGNNIAVFFNNGFDRCTVENIVTYGGQAIRATGYTGYETAHVDEITHFVEDDNLYGLQITVGAEIEVGRYKCVIRNKEISIGTKQLIYLSGKSDNTLNIGEMIVDLRQVASGMLSAFLPVQFAADFGLVRIREYIQYNGPNVAQARGISSFVQGVGSAAVTYGLQVDKAKFYTTATTISSLNPSIKTGSLNSASCKIVFNYEIFGEGCHFDSRFKKMTLASAGKFVPHGYDLAVAASAPYVCASEDMEVALVSGSLDATAVLQPPAYVGQKWLLRIGGPRNIPITINSVTPTVITGVPGTTILLTADSLQGWTQFA